MEGARRRASRPRRGVVTSPGCCQRRELCFGSPEITEGRIARRFSLLLSAAVPVPGWFAYWCVVHHGFLFTETSFDFLVLGGLWIIAVIFFIEGARGFGGCLGLGRHRWERHHRQWERRRRYPCQYLAQLMSFPLAIPLPLISFWFF